MYFDILLIIMDLYYKQFNTMYRLIPKIKVTVYQGK